MKFASKAFTVIFLSLLILSSENANMKLNGKIISSDPLTSPSINNAFDGDLSTSFTSKEASKGWIGLKLDSKYLITKIGFAFPINSKKEDYLLSILEGSNEPTFTDSTILYMITEELKLGEMNYISIKTNSRFKYIRYIGPNNKYCVISELEIYGDDELGTNTRLNVLSSKNDKDYYYQATNLPLVIINTEDSVEPFDKETYITCTVTIIKDNKIVKKEKARIKLRGNSTSRLDKKSYRLKFDSKQKILDMPAKAKNWAIIANYSDKTLMRYLLAHKISSLFELTYSPACESVDMIVNGEFQGNFGFCDQIEEGKGRIEVTEMDQTCIEEPELTGGYVIAADGWARQGGDKYYLSTKGVVLVIKFPKDNDIVKEQETYILNTFNKVEDDCYNNVIDKIDIDTFCKYLLVEDLTGNGETFWSTYMYKERGDDKIYFGPVWDFDLAFDNNNRVYPTLEKKDFIYKYDISAGTMNTLATKILSNENVIKRLKETWSSFTESKVTKNKLIDYISEIIDKINESQKLNFIRWDILNTKILLNPVARGSFEAETDYLKYFIVQRFDILDEIVKKASYETINAEVETKRKHHHRKDEESKTNNLKNFNTFLLGNDE
jgi:hypothetical protein